MCCAKILNKVVRQNNEAAIADSIPSEHPVVYSSIINTLNTFYYFATMPQPYKHIFCLIIMHFY